MEMKTVFSERMALKSRLDELNHSEERLLKQFQNEREQIYVRLRKLDEEERFLQHSSFDSKDQVASSLDNISSSIERSETSLTKKEISELLSIIDDRIHALRKPESNIPDTKELYNNEKIRNATNRRGKPSLNAKIDYDSLYKEALSILKRHTASVQSVDIKKELEQKTGYEIPNMTNFMERLMKKEPLVEKPYRGMYIYRTPQVDSIAPKSNEDVSSTDIEIQNEVNEQDKAES